MHCPVQPKEKIKTCTARTHKQNGNSEDWKVSLCRHLLTLLLRQLGQFLEHLAEVLSVLGLALLALAGLGNHHHHTGRALRGGRGTSSAREVTNT